MSAREPLSVAVITHNEEQNLRRCLASVGWAEEIVVVDAGSSDRTVDVAREHGARVFERRWDGYEAQKNFALERTRHRWVLSLDADEWLSPLASAEVGRALEAPEADAFALDRLTGFCGAFLERTWSPDWQVRLFRKDRGRFGGGRVHESLQLDAGSEIVRLRGRLMHAGYGSLQDYLERLNHYTELAVTDLGERGERFSRLRLALSPAAAFLKFFVLRGGFRDGTRGFVASAGSAFYVFAKHAKLWERSELTRPGTSGNASADR